MLTCSVWFPPLDPLNAERFLVDVTILRLWFALRWCRRSTALRPRQLRRTAYFDIVVDHFWRVSQPFATPRALCGMLCFVPMPMGCRLALGLNGTGTMHACMAPLANLRL